jgi:hypothetical protein
LTDELHPNFAMMYLTEFEHAYQTHQAAGAVRLIRNRTSVDKTMSPEMKVGRQQLLDIATALLINQRDAALDQFCTSWLKFRHLPIPEKE